MDRAATETKIRRDYLVAMEKDDFGFQAPVYVKGFLTNYARFLRIEPAPLVQRFVEMTGGEPNEALVLAEQNATWSGTVRMPSAFRPLVITTCALLILTTIALWTRAAESHGERPAVRVQTAPADTNPAANADASGSTKPVAADPAAASSERKRMSVRIVAASARSWVRIIRGERTVFQGTLELGQQHTVQAKDPLRITLGFPAGVELTVDGRNLGSPGGKDVLELALPDDLPSLS